jgi:hypothetical protein
MSRPLERIESLIISPKVAREVLCLDKNRQAVPKHTLQTGYERNWIHLHETVG